LNSVFLKEIIRKMKYRTEIINKNEITKSEYDQLKELRKFDEFTPEQVLSAKLSIHSLIKKGETQELTQDELDIIKSGTEELNNLTRYTINEMINGRICKSDIYVQPMQVMWEDTLEKSLDGETIKKGIYLDTELNRKLDRVGDVIIKGKTMKKKEEMEEEDDMDEDEKMEIEKSEMYKACMSKIVKGEGVDKESMIEEMEKVYPDMDKDKMKKYIKKAYKNVSKVYMKKSQDYSKMAADEDEE